MEQYEKLYLYKRIVQAKLFIDHHYAENIDLSNIADEAHFSKFHFIRLFTSIYGQTPHNYLTKVRIDNAKLLLSKGISVMEASLTVGFDSPTSFTAAFKKYAGKTPSEFQTGQKARTLAIKRNPLSAIPDCFVSRHGWGKIAIPES